MSQTLSIQTFLRKYPADLVARYFGSVYGCKSSALAKRSSSRQGKIVAWQGLQPEVRDKVESELGEVIAMSDETGLHAIQTLLSFDTLAPIEKNGDECKKEAETIETRVFRTFIERKSIWPQAVDLAFADRISSRFWKKRNNVPADGLDTSREACEALKERIGAFLAKTDSRGKSCDVEKSSATIASISSRRLKTLLVAAKNGNVESSHPGPLNAPRSWFFYTTRLRNLCRYTARDSQSFTKTWRPFSQNHAWGLASFPVQKQT